MNFYRAFYLNKSAFVYLAVCLVFFSFGLVADFLFVIGKGLFVLFWLLCCVETFWVFSSTKPLYFKRKLPNRLSNGDINFVELTITNHLNRPIYLQIYEDLPEQLQLRMWELNQQIEAQKTQQFSYKISPKVRGIYVWQNTYILIRFFRFSFISRKITFENHQEVECYPSFEQFKKIPIKATVNAYQESNTENYVRKIGQSLEFEQIKDYSLGDDYRHINWKASAKRGQLMLNQYQDERSQDIYCVLDMGRAMKTSFDSQTLLDFAVNASLGLTKTIISMQDKAGIIGFSHKSCEFIPARKDLKQFTKINDFLFNLQSDFYESNFELLYKFSRVNIKQRSLFIIFTHFDSVNSLYRQMPYLKSLAKYHVVLVVFYENTDIVSFVKKQAKTLKEIYFNTIGQSFLLQNRLIIKALHNAGIHSLLIPPKNLNLEVINKFIEIKRKNLI